MMECQCLNSDTLLSDENNATVMVIELSWSLNSSTILGEHFQYPCVGVGWSTEPEFVDFGQVLDWALQIGVSLS